jgi:hypothetical protein
MMVVMVVVPFSSGLDNGLALTPQMGWSSWLVKLARADHAFRLQLASALHANAVIH